MKQYALLAQYEGSDPYVVLIGSEAVVKATLFDRLASADETEIRNVKQIPSDRGRAFTLEESDYDPAESTKPRWQKKTYYLQEYIPAVTKIEEN